MRGVSEPEPAQIVRPRGRPPIDPVPVPAETPTPLDRALAHLPGWLFLAGGVALLAVFVLLPEWQRTRALAERVEAMREQRDAVQRQLARHERFHEALAAGDPVLLERLAFTELRERPADAAVVAVSDPATPADARKPPSEPPTPGAYRRWLYEPLPTPPPAASATVESGPVFGSRRNRLITIIAAGCCIGLGLWPRLWGHRDDTDG